MFFYRPRIWPNGYEGPPIIQFISETATFADALSLARKQFSAETKPSTTTPKKPQKKIKTRELKSEKRCGVCDHLFVPPPSHKGLICNTCKSRAQRQKKARTFGQYADQLCAFIGRECQFVPNQQVSVKTLWSLFGNQWSHSAFSKRMHDLVDSERLPELSWHLGHNGTPAVWGLVPKKSSREAIAAILIPDDVPDGVRKRKQPDSVELEEEDSDDIFIIPPHKRARTDTEEEETDFHEPLLNMELDDDDRIVYA